MNSAGDRPLDSAGILLDMRNVAVDAPCPETRQDNRIVDNVSLVLRRGEVLGIIGESGAGKSTVGLASLAYGRGGTRISAGEVWFKGVDLRTLSAQQLRIIRGSKVAYVSQSAAAAFNPAHRLIDQVIETAVVKGILSRNDARQRALALFAALKLPHPEELALRYPHQLSGGQLQRVMTAMALCPKPDLIVFDEPTTALDVTTQIEVLVAIKETIRAEKTAALYISHDLALVAQIADRILVLRHGKFVETGATRQILEDPQQSYTSRLVKVSLTKARSDLPLPEESVTLSVRRVTAAYGLGRNVLSDVSLAVARGRTLAIVGESGSGKSSLARTIAGLLAPSRGEMEFLGRPLAPLWRDRTREQLRQIQLVYQCPDTALNPRQTVADIIGRPLSFYHGARGAARRRRSIELLGLVEMGEHFLSRRPADLSGGQKQRVCIARALAAEPKLLICDEITAALDPLVAEEVLKMMLRLQQQTQLSFVFITHDISIVRAIADSVAVMHNGNIVRYGTNLECFSPPYDAYTELLLESVPEMRPGWLNELLTGRNQLSSKIAGGTNAVSVGMAPS